MALAMRLSHGMLTNPGCMRPCVQSTALGGRAGEETGKTLVLHGYSLLPSNGTVCHFFLKVYYIDHNSFKLILVLTVF